MKSSRKWWKYAYNVVVEQRVRPYTWQSIKRHRENYHKYMQTYKSTLRSPNDTELKLDLQKCEDSLPIISVVIAREQAKFEVIIILIIWGLSYGTFSYSRAGHVKKVDYAFIAMIWVFLKCDLY